MPCNCDHLEPNSTEVLLSKVACLLDELAGKPINKTHWSGMHPSVYCQTYDRYASPFDHAGMVLDLVSKLEHVDVSKYSLEMQIWWRDYNGGNNKIMDILRRFKDRDRHIEDMAALTDTVTQELSKL